LRVEIESIAFGGGGIARKDGKVFFVKGGLPHDVLEIRVINDKGSYAEAVIDAVVGPSRDRVEPTCPVFGICGGCQFQNLGYSAQLREKANMLRETVERIGGLRGVHVDTIFPSPSEYGYRRRTLLSAWYFSGGWHVGYFQEKSRKHVKVVSCPISDSSINDAISRLSDVLSSIRDPRYPLEKIYLSSDGISAYITLVPHPRTAPSSLGALVRYMRRFDETKNVSVIGNRELEFEFPLMGYRFLTSPSVFTQSNTPVNEAIIDTVIDWSELKGTETILELYSGIGNFSVPLSAGAIEVICVEINKRSAAFARRNAELNGVRNIVFNSGSCEEYLSAHVVGAPPVDVVVLDPPREGAKDVVPGVMRLSPEKIIYVSCDPATLARDLKTFRVGGYELARIRPFDMFPETYHIESVSLLVKSEDANRS
jgi:23S rRNA (uracil1939-C5)-methyltransferase